MSLGQISRTGAKTPIAGLNGLSGELVPSVSYYRTGSVSLPALDAGASQDITITLPNAMPDNNYVVVAYPGYPAYTFSYTPVSATQFTISVKNQDSVAHGEGLIRWRAFKLMTDESRALDEQAIADNTAAIAGLKASSKIAITVPSGVGSVDCYRNGNVITVSYNSGSLSVAAATTLATGLPKPANANAYFSLLNVSGTPAAKCASLDNNGVLKAYTAFTAYTVGCFSYIAAS